MATIRFGSSTDSCRLISDTRSHNMEETYETKNIDPENLLQCPFDANHLIRSCRFPYHLIKCRKNHPKLASELKTCPYNARHLVPKHELAYHMETCDYRVSDTQAGEENGQWHVPVSTWVNPNMSEDWDKEVEDDAAAPFVWGEPPRQPEVKPTNSLSGCRMPTTLPWSAY